MTENRVSKIGNAAEILIRHSGLMDAFSIEGEILYT